MRTFQRFVTLAWIWVVLIISTVLWSDIQQRWFLQKLYIRKSIASNTTNKMFWEAQYNRTSTPSCKNVNFYELYNKTSPVNNATPYVTCQNPFKGRLGNQMFKYASMLGISRAQGRRMFFQSNTSLASTFKITHVAANISTIEWPLVNEHTLFNDKLFDLPMYDVKIRGSLQSFWYFASVSDEVRQQFTFHDSIANDADNILHGVYVKYKASVIVGVHVRRGDFLEEGNKGKGYGVPEKSYFTKAFSLMKSYFPGRSVTFLVASDDLNWCSENFLDNEVSIMPPASSAVHLAVLSKCDHMIISGGTFGWWGGWLANGRVIYYNGYMEQTTTYGYWFKKKEQYYPRMWIGLGN